MTQEEIALNAGIDFLSSIIDYLKVVEKNPSEHYIFDEWQTQPLISVDYKM